MWAEAKAHAERGDFDAIQPELLIKHLNAFQQIRNMAISRSKPMERFTLRLWQQDLLDILQGTPDERAIHWYWEATGSVGKSWMATFLARNHGALTVSTGKTQDIAYMFQPTRIVCFDISRAVDMDHVNFSVMEDIKNGRLMSSKYMSCVKYFDSPHVVVFANSPPPHGKFSADRLRIVEIGNTQRNTVATNTNGSYASGFRVQADAAGVPPPLRRQRTEEFEPIRLDEFPELDLPLDQDIMDILNAGLSN